MTQIRRILSDLQDTDLTLERLKTLALVDPLDEISRINWEAIEKRRKDLERRLNYELTAQQTDIVQYKVERAEVQRYPAAAVATSLLSFQELLTSVFDAIRSAPKKRYRPSADNVELSSMDFAGARAGSVVIALSVQNERLLSIKSQLDDTFDLIFSILNARTDSTLRELVNRVGVASISRAYNWAETSSSFGFDTSISWSKSATGGEHITITKTEALSLKEAIENTSEEKIETFSYPCELVGIDDEESYFHIKTESAEITGGLSKEFVKAHYVTHERYGASLSKSTITTYSTGEEKERWTLHRLDRM